MIVNGDVIRMAGNKYVALIVQRKAEEHRNFSKDFPH